MVVAIHYIFTAYGFWLPDDPRGSWSETVRVWELLRFGQATTVTTRRSLAHKPHDRALRLEAKGVLKYAPVSFSGEQALAIGNGFKTAIARSGFQFFACSILPEHVHLVVARHRMGHRQVLNQLKGEGSKGLERAGMHPFSGLRLPSGRRHTPWADNGWSVFLDSTSDVHRAIRYVENNPVKENLRAQRWSFVEEVGKS